MLGDSMRKRIAFILVTVCVLLITGCRNSNSAEEPIEADSQIMENVEQRDTVENTASENIDDATESSEIQESAKKEDWEDKALLEEYAAYGIEEEDNFYYYQGELVYIIKDQRPDSSVYLLNTDSKGTVSIKVIRNAEGEITSVTYMTEEEVAKALPRILGGANEVCFAELEKSSWQQRERIEDVQEEKRAKEREQAGRTFVQADSIEELIDKIKNVDCSIIAEE